jgi:hypothetical protein
VRGQVAQRRPCFGDSKSAVRGWLLHEGVAHVTGQRRRDPEDLVFGTGLRGRELTAALTHAEIKDKHVTKRYRLSAPSYMSPNAGGKGGVVGSKTMITAVRMEPK